jgi:hypothetical protein
MRRHPRAWRLIRGDHMLKLEDIKKDAQVRGIQGDEVVRIVQVEPVGDSALTVYYKDSQGRSSARTNLALSWHRQAAPGPSMRPVQSSNWDWKPTGFLRPPFSIP